jgi:hypothetical protein
MNSWNAAGANFTYINQQNNSIHTIVTQSATLNQNVLGQEFPTAGVWVSGVKWQKTASLVKINTGSGYVWSTASTCPSKSYDVESVIVHELGHTLGLFHENSNTAYTMHEYLSNGTTDHRSLETDDKNGSKAIYP